jgi:hypothetical protein
MMIVDGTTTKHDFELLQHIPMGIFILRREFKTGGYNLADRVLWWVGFKNQLKSYKVKR